jgi:oligogalacturonide lyase
MRKTIMLSLVFAVMGAAAFAQTAPTDPAAGGGRRGGGRRGGGAAADGGPPVESLRKEWIDADTGHKVYRLSVQNGSGSLYFHYNAYSADGKTVVFNSPAGIMEADLASKKAELVVPASGNGGRVSAMETSRVANEVFYVDRQAGAIMAADLGPGHKTREVVKIPQGLQVSCVNSDATLFAGVIMNAPDPDNKAAAPDKIPAENQYDRMFPGKKPEELSAMNRSSADKENRLARQLTQAVTGAPRCLFTLNAKTGEVKRFGYAHAWLNHLQFSPTDPNMLMFCHEGTWHEVDRVWTINVADADPKPTLMHKRTMDMEIAGHEWWGADGKSVWFDLQKPRSQKFFVAGVDLATLKETDYPITQNQWGVHYNRSKDGTMLSSDGGDDAQVAFAPDGMWMNLFHVQPNGTLTHERLVNMKKHNYVTPASGGVNGVEPNGTFSPDGKLLIFTGNFDGAQHAYAVETAKAK